ncbi:hypothetical protein BAE44_0014457 [Dichanthelium oligosanthes]|uniref:Uncharacterized protein n=1 Tax=Dichanthelium oligosanthes TaxID=888268 RepID=A0A1E5VHH5_9POAL|nr:hypothetical protein BAE44_0014457 [Dichanthelium oligosanthes]
MHCSKKKGFSETVQKAIVDMEAMVATPAQDGKQAKSSTEAVSHVLLRSSTFLRNHVLPRSSIFLRNVGLQSVSNISSKGAISVRVQDLQTQLESERQEAAGLGKKWIA